MGRRGRPETESVRKRGRRPARVRLALVYGEARPAWVRRQRQRQRCGHYQVAVDLTPERAVVVQGHEVPQPWRRTGEE